MSKTQDYIDQYAEFAMEQMERYGIPASITLAQAIIESGRGQSRLSRLENNHFGIKASQSWLSNGGAYALYTDDAPNEKFCSYDSVRDSFEHHSRFIVDNKRYGNCLTLAVNDYRGWAEELQKAGYATAGHYSSSLISIIESNNLQKYDQMVISSPGRYATDYQANLPDSDNYVNHRGLNRDNVADQDELANQSKDNLESQDLKEDRNLQDKQDKDLANLQLEEGEDFESWMKKLISGTDEEGKSLSNSSDPITGMVITMFTSLFAIAAMIDNNKTPLEKSAEARRAVNDQEIDLTPMLKQQSLQINQQLALSLPQDMKVEDIRSCKFRVTEQARATIVIEDNMGRTHSFGVSSKELSNLQSTLNTPNISTQQKTMAVAAFIGTSMARNAERSNNTDNQQLANSNSVDQANKSSISMPMSVAKEESVASPTVTLTKNSAPAPTITVSSAAQMSSRNYDIAENQTQSREGQSYTR